jgi:hypothetical protein
VSPRPTDISEAQSRQAALFLVGSIIVTVLLYYVIPYGRTIGRPLMLLSTLAHEMGHGIAGVMMGGDFIKFEMFWNGSGVATTSGHFGRFANAFISAGGLVGPAIVAAIGFAVGRTPKGARRALVVFGIGLILADVLVVRNVFGLVFVAAVAALCLLIAAKGKPWASQLTLLFIASQLALSVFSRGDYLFTATANTSRGPMPSDVAQMAENLFLPYWFWGAVCGLFAVAVLVLGLRAFFGSDKT